MTRPNLFLIGHPRSGTGTIDGQLQQHPEIYMANKELHYFGSDLFYNSPPRSLENYLQYFPEKTTTTYIGESSTWYLASKTAADEIYNFAPSSKIILSIRNPVDWLYSLHSHMVYAAYEDTVDFAQALAKEEERVKGNLPQNAYPPMGVCYKSLVQYTSQIQTYWNVFGKENVHIILFDDLKKNPEETLNKTLQFLSLSHEFPNKKEALSGSKKQKNSNHGHRSSRLHHWIKSGRRRAILHGTREEKIPGSRLFIRALHRFNTITKERAPMDKKLRKSLISEFIPQVESLETVLNVDLTSWKHS
ncbi:MAG: hypothetical protein CL916_11565 [Deltaproteobacteria bacterium]|nr:hypothetical protein [Deltaproteobacteria bacterium]